MDVCALAILFVLFVATRKGYRLGPGFLLILVKFAQVDTVGP